MSRIEVFIRKDGTIHLECDCLTHGGLICNSCSESATHTLSKLLNTKEVKEGVVE